MVVLDSVPVSTSGYEVDVAVRQSAASELAGIVFGSPRELPITSARLADRAHLPILCSNGERTAVELLLELDRFARGGASDALARAKAAMRDARKAAEADGPASAHAVLDAASVALGYDVLLDETVPVDSADPGVVMVGQHAVARVTAEVDDDAGVVALPAIAALVSRQRQSELNRRFAPALSRAELIVQIVLSERERLPQLLEQAFQLDFPAEQTHIVAWLHVEDAQHRGNAPMDRTRQIVDEAQLTALQVLHPSPGMWHVAVLGGDLIVVRTGHSGAELHGQMRTEAAGLADLLTERGDITVFGGIGTAQQGPDGLRQSAAEAKVAVDSTRAAGLSGTVAETDAIGMRRIMAGLYASPLSRHLLDEILAPLDALGDDRAGTAVTTLAAYLDVQGSPTRAAKLLHLHPNAVSYRLRWITETLGVDLDDPDVRFALQMACRARLLNA